MDTALLIEIIESCTRVLRKERRNDPFIPTSYPTFNRSEPERFDRLVDVYFAVVVVDMNKADSRLAEFEDEWGAVLANVTFVGPTFIEVGVVLGSHELGLRLIALGHALGFWKIMTPVTIGFPDGSRVADELAYDGMVMISLEQ